MPAVLLTGDDSGPPVLRPLPVLPLLMVLPAPCGFAGLSSCRVVLLAVACGRGLAASKLLVRLRGAEDDRTPIVLLELTPELLLLLLPLAPSCSVVVTLALMRKPPELLVLTNGRPVVAGVLWLLLAPMAWACCWHAGPALRGTAGLSCHWPHLLVAPVLLLRLPAAACCARPAAVLSCPWLLLGLHALVLSLLLPKRLCVGGEAGEAGQTVRPN